MSARRLALLAAACLALGGCVATQKDVLEIENQSDELKHQILELKQTISSLQANQADLSVNMKELHNDLNTFNETVKESQANMAQLSSKLDDMSAGVASKVASLGETLTTQQAKGLAEQKATLAKQQGPSPTELFHVAEVRLAKKDYELASKGFEEYASKFPKGALIDVAIYNLGEAYFGLKRWEDAGKQFGTLLERFPKSDSTPSARLMYALCLEKLNRNLPEAKQFLESVIADYPSRPEAKAAAKHLKKIESKIDSARTKTTKAADAPDEKEQ